MLQTQPKEEVWPYKDHVCMSTLRGFDLLHEQGPEGHQWQALYLGQLGLQATWGPPMKMEGGALMGKKTPARQSCKAHHAHRLIDLPLFEPHSSSLTYSNSIGACLGFIMLQTSPLLIFTFLSGRPKPCHKYDEDGHWETLLHGWASVFSCGGPQWGCQAHQLTQQPHQSYSSIDAYRICTRVIVMPTSLVIVMPTSLVIVMPTSLS